MRKRLPVYLMSGLNGLAALIAKQAPAEDALDILEREPRFSPLRATCRRRRRRRLMS